MLRKLSTAFTGGTFGALAASLLFWELGRDGVTAWLGIALHPSLSPAWLYPRLVIGGLWGLLLLLPLFPDRPATRGMLLGLVPAAHALFYQLPAAGRGLFGLGYGQLTPVLIVLLNLTWGMCAALWFRHARCYAPIL
jgi:hypothetical protein